jgi:hypothetical protein
MIMDIKVTQLGMKTHEAALDSHGMRVKPIILF